MIPPEPGINIASMLLGARIKKKIGIALHGLAIIDVYIGDNQAAREKFEKVHENQSADRRSSG